MARADGADFIKFKECNILVKRLGRSMSAHDRLSHHEQTAGNSDLARPGKVASTKGTRRFART